MIKPITIRRIDDGSSLTQHRYRVEGGKNFSKVNETPWCEFTIRHSGNQLECYRGAVWPSAWPHLFENHSGPFTLATAEGLRLISDAERAFTKGLNTVETRLHPDIVQAVVDLADALTCCQRTLKHTDHCVEKIKLARLALDVAILKTKGP